MKTNQQEKCAHKKNLGESCSQCNEAWNDMTSPHQEAWAERLESARSGAHDTYNGGWDGEPREAFHHGMNVGIDIAKEFIKDLLTTLHKADCERFRGMLQENNRVIQHKYQMQGERSAIRYETSLEIRRALADMTENVLTALQKFEEEKV